MRVDVDELRCQGHTRCNALAPEIFKLRDSDGHAYVVAGDLPDALEATLKRAVSACPERALTLMNTLSLNAGTGSDEQEGTP